MDKKELLRKAKYYGIKIDTATKKLIETRLVSINHRIDTHASGNSYKVYETDILRYPGQRNYKGSKLYCIYDSILTARKNVLAEMAENRDVRNNPEDWASEEDLSSLFNTVGKTNLGRQA